LLPLCRAPLLSLLVTQLPLLLLQRARALLLLHAVAAGQHLQLLPQHPSGMLLVGCCPCRAVLLQLLVGCLTG
jgi:hypothetical protein